jgi:hypothetical protein
MAIEHNVIPDAQRHEPKHASTATANQVNKANGDGTTKYDFVAWSEITGKPSPVGYSSILYGKSTATSQQPSATNTALQVEFGAGGTSTDGSVTLASNGNLTFNTAGYYALSLFLRFGRTGTSGQAILFNRVLINNVQALSSNSTTIDAAAQVNPFSATLFITANAGDVWRMEILRDAAGANDGGLFRTTTSTSGWVDSPSASLNISRYLGL